MQNNIVRRNLIWALIINLIIFELEVMGLYFSVLRWNYNTFQFYTNNSNYLALIISGIFCISCVYSLKTKTPIANWIRVLRFISTTCLTLTLTIVLFVLLPMLPSSFNFMMVQTSNLFYHVLCPILSIISFVFFENQQKLTRSSIYFAVLPTVIYGLIAIILNILKVIEGPYPFFYVYEMPWHFSTVWCIGIVLYTYLIALSLYGFYNFKHYKLEAKSSSNQQAPL